MITYGFAGILNDNHVYLMVNDGDYTIFVENTTENVVDFIVEGFKEAFKETVKSVTTTEELFAAMNVLVKAADATKKARIIKFVETEEKYIFPDLKPTYLEIETFADILNNEK